MIIKCSDVKINIRGGSLEGSTIYVTLFPCNECAKAIIQCGIREVVYDSDKYASAPVVENGIQFTVGRVKVFVVIAFAYPWEIIIGTSGWKSIISHGKNFVFVTDKYASTPGVIASKKMLRAAGVTLRHYEHTNREVKLSLPSIGMCLTAVQHFFWRKKRLHAKSLKHYLKHKRSGWSK